MAVTFKHPWSSLVACSNGLVTRPYIQHKLACLSLSHTTTKTVCLCSASPRQNSSADHTSVPFGSLFHELQSACHHQPKSIVYHLCLFSSVSVTSTIHTVVKVGTYSWSSIVHDASSYFVSLLRLTPRGTCKT